MAGATLPNGRVSRGTWIAAAAFGALGVGVRLFDAFRYPPDWGFDATFNWRYIYRMSRDWEIPHPAAGWSTSDPPLYYAAAAALWSASGENVLVVPLSNVVLGLALVVLAWWLVRRIAPYDPARALLAGGLLLFLPAHLQMSVMVNEGMLAALLTSVALALVAARGGSDADARFDARRAAVVGAAAGLATLAKLTGAIAAAAAAGAYVLEGARRGAARRAAEAVAVLALATVAAGGWYFARNAWLYGFFQPEMLPVHERMFDMPPGERGPGDYLRLPLATFTAPQMDDPDLLRSVWGGTYVTTWFDGHRHLLPRDDAGVTRLGTLTLLLALLPTAAFLAGGWRSLRRARASPGGPDAVLLLYTVLSLAAYAVFTWRNPFFASVKGTTLLGLALPFACFASEALVDWARRGRVAAALVWGLLALLAACVVAGGAYGLFFEPGDAPGIPWKKTAAP